MRSTRRALGVGAVVLVAVLISMGWSGAMAKAPHQTVYKKQRKQPSTTVVTPTLPYNPVVTVPQAQNPPQTVVSMPTWSSNPIYVGTDAWKQLCSSTALFNDAAVVGGTPWKTTKASTFYIGEEAGPSNANISNISTAWSSHAVTDFANAPDRWGPKDPANWQGTWYTRDGWCPQLGAGGVIKQNPFYVALPTPDYTSTGPIPEAQKWTAFASQYLPELKKYPNGQFPVGESPFKNLWVAVEYNGKIALAQLEDVGPSSHEGVTMADYGFVWDPAVLAPKNNFGVQAGIDLSPALTDYLGTKGEATVRFRFIPAAEVQKQLGPWTMLVTTSGPRWD